MSAVTAASMHVLCNDLVLHTGEFTCRRGHFLEAQGEQDRTPWATPLAAQADPGRDEPADPVPARATRIDLKPATPTP